MAASSRAMLAGMVGSIAVSVAMLRRVRGAVLVKTLTELYPDWIDRVFDTNRRIGPILSIKLFCCS